MKRTVKKIERALRRTTLRALAGRRRPPERTGLLPSESPRILLLRHDRIGDAIISTPILTLLRQRFPEARIDLLLGRRNAVAAPLIPAVDRAIVPGPPVIPFVDSILRLRRARYDLCINLLTKDSASGAAIASLCGAKTTIGFEGNDGALYDINIVRPSSRLHIVRETSMLLEPLGIPTIGPEPAGPAERLKVVLDPGLIDRGRSIVNSLGAGAGAIVINISCPDPTRSWGIDRFVELGEELRKMGRNPIFAATPADAAPLTEIARRSGAPSLPVTGSFAEFAGMLAGASTVITPDTSVVHLAAALGTPTVMLAASREMTEVWSPWGVPFRAFFGHGSASDIPLADVVAAVASLGNETERSQHPSTRA